MNRIRILLVCLPLFSGCVQVPQSRLDLSRGLAFLPKDWTAEKLHLTGNIGTNRFDFYAENMTTKNNPEVINASTAQLKAVIDATANAVGTATAAGLKAAAK